MVKTEAREIEILLVEDNESDVELTREALAEHKSVANLHVVSDGERAMQFLKRRGPYRGSPRPDLILLDLNLPKKDGREVLEEIKVDDDLKVIPVVVLTTSQAEEDIIRSYELQANCFVTKPVKLKDFLGVVRSIDHFWLSIASLPTVP